MIISCLLAIPGTTYEDSLGYSRILKVRNANIPHYNAVIYFSNSVPPTNLPAKLKMTYSAIFLKTL